MGGRRQPACKLGLQAGRVALLAGAEYGPALRDRLVPGDAARLRFLRTDFFFGRRVYFTGSSLSWPLFR